MRPAFTRTELLVTLATLTLLGLILIPTLARAAGGSTRATCLQNLQALGAATQMYAEEDATELLIPIHQMAVVDNGQINGYWYGTRWGWRTANWYTWGGATASEPFLVVEGDGPTLGQGTVMEWYGAQTRPLTRFLYPDITEDPSQGAYVFDLPAFRCPQDAGYPVGLELADAPESNAGRPCYATLGSSYRANRSGWLGESFAFSISPYGHKRADLVRPERTIFGGDALYGEMLDGAVEFLGWHGALQRDNVLYCDGSARLTHFGEMSPLVADPRLPLDPAIAESTLRGDTYQIDVYPTPGASIFNSSVSGAATGWPFEAAKANLKPVSAPWE